MNATISKTTAHQLRSLQYSTSVQELPLYTCRIAAGFASPADDHLDNKIYLNKLMVPTPSATYMLNVEGHSMTGAGIFDGDMLIVDRSKTAKNGSIVIAVVMANLPLNVCDVITRAFGWCLKIPISKPYGLPKKAI